MSVNVTVVGEVIFRGVLSDGGLISMVAGCCLFCNVVWGGVLCSRSCLLRRLM